MNYYPFHLGDYAAHTAHLEPMEDLAYRRMLDLYYLRECALPQDPAEVARLIRMRSNVAEVEAVLREFFTFSDADGWIHLRCEAELGRMQDKQAKAKASAQASVDARIARQKSERSTTAQRPLNDRSTDVELPTPTPTPTPTPKTSEANASDAAASASEPESAKAALWRESVVVLKAGGCPESLCRSFMGKLVKDYGEPVVRDAVTAAISAQPADAREYLKGTCQRLKGERKDPVTVPSTDKGAELFKAAMDERAAAAVKPPAHLLALAGKAVRAA